MRLPAGDRRMKLGAFPQVTYGAKRDRGMTRGPFGIVSVSSR